MLANKTNLDSLGDKIQNQEGEMNDTQASRALNWQEGLSEEVWLLILSWVSPLEQLQSADRVSKMFHRLLAKKPYWEQNAKSYLSFKNPTQNLDVLLPLLSKRDLQIFCLQLTEIEENTPDEAYPSFYEHGNRLVDMVTAFRIRHSVSLRTCLATSTEHPEEALETVLPGIHRVPDEMLRSSRLRQRWWSSRPSDTQNSNDTLLFLTDCGLAVLTHVAIRPLLDPFTRHVIYSWQNIVVRAYRLPPTKVRCPTIDNRVINVISAPMDDEGRSEPAGADDDHLGPGVVESRQDKSLLKNVIHGEVPVWESAQESYEETDEVIRDQGQVKWQKVSFPPGIVANAITITLIGKNSQQFVTSGYYACVNQVNLSGTIFIP